MSIWAEYLDDLHRVDIRRWRREGVICPGSQFSRYWRNGSGIFAHVDEELDSIRLDVHDSGVRYQTLPLEWTECNFGGARPWFKCPQCRRRSAKLYRRYTRFVCRTCCQLIYRSQA